MAQAVSDPHADALKAATLPAGTVLAARYRLEELLAESRPTVTWRAFDQVLSRSVLVHLLSPGDAGADDLLAAARRASVATTRASCGCWMRCTPPIPSSAPTSSASTPPASHWSWC